MRLLLYNPRSSASRKPVLPMSLLALGAVLEGRRDYAIVDGNLDPDPLATLAALAEADGSGTVLGVTVMPGPQLAEAAPVCRELKRRKPGLTVVWGGYFPSQHWDVCLKSGYVDYVLRGHAELPFAALLDALEAGALQPLALPGLAWNGPGGPQSNGVAPVPRPAELPDWNLERLPVERYLRRTFLGRRTLGYHSSYGCPFLCNFCAVVNLVGGRWLAQPAERVARNLVEYRRRWGMDAVELNDNNFFVDQARVAEFSQRMLGQGIAWWGEGRVDTLLRFSDDTWRLMAQSGLRMVYLGAESGSQETLDRMDKGGTLRPEDTLALVELMGRHGVVPELSFVLGNPPDPEGDTARTLAFVRRAKRLNPAAEVVLYLYSPVPLEGSLLSEARQSGFAFPETLDEWLSPRWQDFTQRRSAGLPWLGRSLHHQVRDFERVLNAYYPSSTLSHLGPATRGLLRLAAAWRWHAGLYGWSYELSLLHRLVRYRRPEASGF